jgi:IMP dehydrogenase
MIIYSKEDLNSSKNSLTYNDISLVPAYISEISSRSLINTSTKFLDRELAIPVLSSPMDSVSGPQMAELFYQNKSLAVLSRFIENYFDVAKEVLNNSYKGISIGLEENNESNVLLELCNEHSGVVCLDTANASNSFVLKRIENIKSKYQKLKLIVGNIAHSYSLLDIVNSGADAVRVGIGSGSMCTTSIKTGIGIGQVSSILNVFFKRKELGLKIEIIADGGIKTEGDIVKAIALGADAVMLGRMLAGCQECPGDTFKDQNGQLCKKYRGSASFAVKRGKFFVEGEETIVPYQGSANDVLRSIKDGLQSAMSYLNCSSIEELKQLETFSMLSHNSWLERLPKF